MSSGIFSRFSQYIKNLVIDLTTTESGYRKTTLIAALYYIFNFCLCIPMFDRSFPLIAFVIDLFLVCFTLIPKLLPKRNAIDLFVASSTLVSILVIGSVDLPGLTIFRCIIFPVLTLPWEFLRLRNNKAKVPMFDQAIIIMCMLIILCLDFGFKGYASRNPLIIAVVVMIAVLPPLLNLFIVKKDQFIAGTSAV